MEAGMVHYNVLIVGAGHAGSQVAIMLRQLAYGGTIAILGEEADLPYERPPLSKEYLQGAKSFDRIMIRPAQFWEEKKVSIVTGHRIVRVEPVEHKAVTESGEEYFYDQLIWATGGAPRRLVCPGSDLAGVHYIRSRADVDQLTDELPKTRRIVVIGGGYIGLEAAAVLRNMDKDVTLVESMDRVLARVAGEPLSRFIEAEHRAHGVDVLLGTSVERLEGDGQRVTAVCLSSGVRLEADLVIVGIGILPSVRPLLEAGAMGTNGIDVDSRCRTSLPNVFAAGDCASHSSHFADGYRVRLESVQNAVDQAAVVARNLMDESSEYRSLPWFWSNQYDLKLQTAGLSLNYDEVAVRGDMATRSFSIDYFKRGNLIAVDCVNSPRDYVVARKVLSERFSQPSDIPA